MTGGCAKRFPARGRAGSIERWAFHSDSRVLVRQIAIINWPNDSSLDLVHISALQDPIAAQGRKPLYWVKRHAWIAPWAARVVNAYRLVYFGFAVHRLRRRERDFPERHANIPMQFGADVNSFAVRKIVAAAVGCGFRGSISGRGRRCEAHWHLRLQLRVDSCPLWLNKKAMRSRAHG